MRDQLAASLRHELLDGLVDEDQPDLRITEVSIIAGKGHLGVNVAFAAKDQHGQFERPFDETDLQMLTEPTLAGTAAAIATWVRLELVEHISELTAAGRWRPGF